MLPRLFGTMILLLVLIGTSERVHWRRSDGHRADPAAVAAALSFCSKDLPAGRDHDRVLGACMSRQGFFTWDGV